MARVKKKNKASAASVTEGGQTSPRRSGILPNVPIIDLFAGPGGLGEGFSAYTNRGKTPFKVTLSIEMDECAHKTLRLRSFFRQFKQGNVPDLYYQVLRQHVRVDDLPALMETQPRQVAAAWTAAENEAKCAELGAEPYDDSKIKSWIHSALGPDRQRPWVLIGGPPCQAYSLIGRASNRRKAGYKPEEDHRHHLYREYVKIIADRWPAVFVMENVKGILSSKLEGQLIFERVLRDLADPARALGATRSRGSGPAHEYTLYSIVTPVQESLFNTPDPTDFLVRCEDYGIPQERHRVILLGIRNDISVRPRILRPKPPTTIDSVIGNLPMLRSGLSRMRTGTGYEYLEDSPDAWIKSIRSQIEHPQKGKWLRAMAANGESRLHSFISNTAQLLSAPQNDLGRPFIECEPDLPKSHPLYEWYTDERLGGVCNHESRLHLDSDLIRYIFVASYAKVYGQSPKLNDFPEAILPAHENAGKGVFNDRFRVQMAGRASTTITSHIAKDGHYYIHYDPLQCRALTVREAARLQTFPDNYLFCGPRTSQYTQVGNAVPPLLAFQIAEIVHDVLVRAKMT